jgi:hypothetical protein
MSDYYQSDTENDPEVDVMDDVDEISEMNRSER